MPLTIFINILSIITMPSAYTIGLIGLILTTLHSLVGIAMHAPAGDAADLILPTILTSALLTLLTLRTHNATSSRPFPGHLDPSVRADYYRPFKYTIVDIVITLVAYGGFLILALRILEILEPHLTVLAVAALIVKYIFFPAGRALVWILTPMHCDSPLGIKELLEDLKRGIAWFTPARRSLNFSMAFWVFEIARVATEWILVTSFYYMTSSASATRWLRRSLHASVASLPKVVFFLATPVFYFGSALLAFGRDFLSLASTNLSRTDSAGHTEPQAATILPASADIDRATIAVPIIAPVLPPLPQPRVPARSAAITVSRAPCTLDPARPQRSSAALLLPTTPLPPGTNTFLPARRVRFAALPQPTTLPTPARAIPRRAASPRNSRAFARPEPPQPEPLAAASPQPQPIQPVSALPLRSTGPSTPIPAPTPRAPTPLPASPQPLPAITSAKIPQTTRSRGTVTPSKKHSHLYQPYARNTSQHAAVASKSLMAAQVSHSSRLLPTTLPLAPAPPCFTTLPPSNAPPPTLLQAPVAPSMPHVLVPMAPSAFDRALNSFAANSGSSYTPAAVQKPIHCVSVPVQAEPGPMQIVLDVHQDAIDVKSIDSSMMWTDSLGIDSVQMDDTSTACVAPVVYGHDSGFYYNAPPPVTADPPPPYRDQRSVLAARRHQEVLKWKARLGFIKDLVDDPPEYQFSAAGVDDELSLLFGQLGVKEDKPAKPLRLRVLHSMRSVLHRHREDSEERFAARHSAAVDTFEVRCQADIARDLLRDWKRKVLKVKSACRTKKRSSAAAQSDLPLENASIATVPLTAPAPEAAQAHSASKAQMPTVQPVTLPRVTVELTAPAVASASSTFTFDAGSQVPTMSALAAVAEKTVEEMLMSLSQKIRSDIEDEYEVAQGMGITSADADRRKHIEDAFKQAQKGRGSSRPATDSRVRRDRAKARR